MASLGIWDCIRAHRFKRRVARAKKKYGRVYINQDYSDIELKLVRSGLLVPCEMCKVQPPIDKDDKVI